MNGKPIFFTSDWHIGHEMSITYDKRPFKDLHHMHETLIARYNSIVPVNGVCYFLGDMGNKTEDIRKVVNRLNGTKVLLWGNHDKGMGTMYNCGFDVVLTEAAIRISNGVRLSMTHCPFKGVFREDTSEMRNHDPDNPENWHGERRKKHQMCSIQDEGQFLLHGHIHSRKDKKISKKILDRQFDVGVVGNNYMPYSLKQIQSWVDTYGK